jgi:hypothetical protein
MEIVIKYLKSINRYFIHLFFTQKIEILFLISENSYQISSITFFTWQAFKPRKELYFVFLSNFFGVQRDKKNTLHNEFPVKYQINQ